MDDCNILNYLEKYGSFINRLVTFVYPEHNPGDCTLIENGKIFIETKCDTTVTSVVFALTGKNYHDFEMHQNDSNWSNMTSIIFDRLDEIGLIIFAMDSVGGTNFTGHILCILKIKENEYCVIQSYVYEYEILLCSGTRKDVMKYINNYASIFGGSSEWTRYDIDLWKKLTNTDISDNFGYMKIDRIDVFLPSKPILFESCMSHMNLLLDEAKENLYYIEYSINLLKFWNHDVHKINVQQLFYEYNTSDDIDPWKRFPRIPRKDTSFKNVEAWGGFTNVPNATPKDIIVLSELIWDLDVFDDINITNLDIDLLTKTVI
jgi:hypothetical protein